MKPFFCLRFDVDTPACLERGIAPLQDLARRQNCRFSFFVSPGRAINRWSLVREALMPNAATSQKATLPLRQKLSLPEILQLLLSNPANLPNYARVVKELAEADHEVGLHGGRNHASWQRYASRWSAERLRKEVLWGLEQLRRATDRAAPVFASPGWNSPASLPRVLRAAEFEVIADDYGNEAHVSRDIDSQLLRAPTDLAGSPGGVGYLEWHRAKKHSDDRFTADLRSALTSSRPIVCLYDHPFYAGSHEINRLEAAIKLARSLGREICPLGEATRLVATAGDRSPPPKLA